jgi:hypothetical protein
MSAGTFATAKLKGTYLKSPVAALSGARPWFLFSISAAYTMGHLLIAILCKPSSVGTMAPKTSLA